jgi:hypothetical protein
VCTEAFPQVQSDIFDFFDFTMENVCGCGGTVGRSGKSAMQRHNTSKRHQLWMKDQSDQPFTHTSNHIVRDIFAVQSVLRGGQWREELLNLTYLLNEAALPRMLTSPLYVHMGNTSENGAIKAEGDGNKAEAKGDVVAVGDGVKAEVVGKEVRGDHVTICRISTHGLLCSREISYPISYFRWLPTELQELQELQNIGQSGIVAQLRRA